MSQGSLIKEVCNIRIISNIIQSFKQYIIDNTYNIKLLNQKDQMSQSCGFPPFIFSILKKNNFER